jgi:hypothetical protein
MAPLDVQIEDSNEERTYSALDEVQALDGLFQFSTSQIIEATAIWSSVMRKKKQTIFPLAIDYVANMIKPMINKCRYLKLIPIVRSNLNFYK